MKMAATWSLLGGGRDSANLTGYFRGGPYPGKKRRPHRCKADSQRIGCGDMERETAERAVETAAFRMTRKKQGGGGKTCTTVDVDRIFITTL